MNQKTINYSTARDQAIEKQIIGLRNQQQEEDQFTIILWEEYKVEMFLWKLFMISTITIFFSIVI